MNQTSFEREIERSGKLFYTIVGVSMLPMLREKRDISVIERIPDKGALKKYDVVLFRRPYMHGRGEYILHRILKLLPDGRYWIVGDNCLDGEIVEAADILGILRAFRRGSRTWRVTDRAYRLYVRLWCAPYPLRFALLRLMRSFRDVLRLPRRILRHCLKGRN